ISLRAYLCDASFLVALQGPEPLIARLAEAVQAPVWPYFLGRKSCPPSRPVFEGVRTFGGDGSPEALAHALAEWHWPAHLTPPRNGAVRVVLECPPGPGASLRRDILLSRTHRRFGPRYTRDGEVRPRGAG